MSEARPIRVNGREVERPEGRLTAADLRRLVGGPEGRAVVALGPEGNRFIGEDQPVPEGVAEFAVVPRFRYGT